MSQIKLPGIAVMAYRAYIRPDENLIREAEWMGELILLAAKHDVPWFKKEELYLYEFWELWDMLGALRQMENEG